MIDLEHTSIGREAHKMKLTDALNRLMDHAIGGVNISGRPSTRNEVKVFNYEGVRYSLEQEIKLMQSMLRVNKFIRSNPSNRKRKLLGLEELDARWKKVLETGWYDKEE
tara:strand:+ start:361 stop:687 length:327 start_codon:yes stop_codon:yes gene_type:complete